MSLTNDVNLSIQLLFLSKISIASKVTPLLVISLCRIFVITGHSHEWGEGLTSQLSVLFLLHQYSFCQINSISEIVDIDQS